MSLRTRFSGGMRALFRRKQDETDLANELQQYLDAAVEQKIAAGMSREAATRAARAELGSPEAVKDWVRDVGWDSFVMSVREDLRFAVRLLRRSPAFTVAAALTLALAIGANTAVFSVINALLLRPLPVAEPERLGMLSDYVDHTRWLQIRERAGAFDGALAVSLPMALNAASGGPRDPVTAVFVSGNFFDVLGVPAAIGRTLSARDDVPGGGPDGAVGVISHGYWQRRFGGADVAGRSIVLGAAPVTIVGVTPQQFKGFEVGQPFDVALPLSAEPIIRGAASELHRPFEFLRVVLRLRAGQSPAQAAAGLRQLQADLPDAAGRTHDEQARFTVLSAATGASELRQPYARPLLTLLGLVGIVLLIASANIANLLLARGCARRHELAIRLAIGASHGRIVRQLLLESAVLAVAGTLFGLAIAAWFAPALAAHVSSEAGSAVLDPAFDGRVFAFAGALTIAATLVFGLLPAFTIASRAAGPHGPLGGTPVPLRAIPGSPATARTTALFLTAQIALSVILAIAAGLLVQTFHRLTAVDLGFDPAGVVVVTVDPPHTPHRPAESAIALEQVAAAVAAVPGVSAAGGSFITPVSGGAMIGELAPPAGAPSSQDGPEVYVNVVTPGWLAASGIRLVEGRNVSARDHRGARLVALVNEAFSRAHFPGQDAVGRTVRIRGQEVEERIIVGVVGDAIYGPRRDGVVPILILPLAQSGAGLPPFGFSVSVRAAGGSSLALTQSLAAALRRHDPALTFSFQSLEEGMRATLARERMLASGAALLALLAIILAAVGVYGVTAYAAAQCEMEIGIRAALGARRSHILRLVLSRTLAATVAGVAVGVAAAVPLSRALESLLFGIGPVDGTTFVGISLVVVAVVMVAAVPPALRGARLDPLTVLRRA